MFSICNVFEITAQDTIENKLKNDFWEKVQFGGGLGLAFGNGYSNISVAPSGIYNFNEKIALGMGLQYSYVKQNGFYQSHIYGGSLISLFNPIEKVQLSAEIEQLRVNSSFPSNIQNIKESFWNTALFLGAGYRTNNITLGLRYNVLHKDKNNVYVDALMPFIRIYF